jgi:hypothetical protein
MLDEIGEDQVVAVDLAKSCSKDVIASKETCVHRAVYQATSAGATGYFAPGKNLMEAYTVVSMAEHSSQVKYLVDLRRK